MRRNGSRKTSTGRSQIRKKKTALAAAVDAILILWMLRAKKEAVSLSGSKLLVAGLPHRHDCCCKPPLVLLCLTSKSLSGIVYAEGLAIQGIMEFLETVGVLEPGGLQARSQRWKSIAS